MFGSKHYLKYDDRAKLSKDHRKSKFYLLSKILDLFSYNNVNFLEIHNVRNLKVTRNIA